MIVKNDYDNLQKSEKPMNLRIKNLSFNPCGYLGDKPEKYSWAIDYWYPNPYYNKENDFIKEGDHYLYPDPPKCRVHKSCFKNKECRYTIATFDYDSHEDFYELHFCMDRPLSLNDEERDIFWKLIKYGNDELN